LTYAREIAFSAAQVYARTAEARGAWDARLEALGVDSLVRGESEGSLNSWASALKWASSPVVGVLGAIEDGAPARGGPATEEIAGGGGRAGAGGGGAGQRAHPGPGRHRRPDRRG